MQSKDALRVRIPNYLRIAARVRMLILLRDSYEGTDTHYYMEFFTSMDTH